MIKRLLLILCSIIILTTTTYAYNSSWQNITLEDEGWCANLPIEYTVYLENETEKDIKKEIEDNKDLNFTKITGKYKIHKGPFDGTPLLIEGDLEDSKFTYTYPTTDSHLIIITPTNPKTNELEYIHEIVECEAVQKEIQTNSSQEENESEPLPDKTFTLNNIKLNFKETALTNQNEIKLSEITNLTEKNLTELENFNKAINLSTQNFSSLEIIIPIEFNSSLDTIETYKYNKNQKIWTKITSSANEENQELTFTTETEGIYAIQKVTEEPEITEIIQEESETINPENDSSGSNPLLIIVIIVAVPIVLILVFLSMKKKPKKSEEIESIQNQGQTTTPKANTQNNQQTTNQEPEKLNNYTEIYNKTKDYVKQYKDNYSKDQIYRALEGANIPKDIIDKVFEQQYE